MDTSTQLGLRRTKIGKAGTEMTFEITDIVRSAVGKQGFELGTDAFTGVEIG